MDVGAINAAGGTHVGNYAEKLSRFQQAQAFDAGLGANHGVAAALQGGSNIGHYGGLVLDEQHGQSSGFSDSICSHRCVTPAAAPTEAGSGVAGRLTTKVAPCPPVLL